MINIGIFDFLIIKNGAKYYINFNIVIFDF
jgi:hypothetical protein